MTISRFVGSLSLVASMAAYGSAQCSLTFGGGTPLSGSNGTIAGVVEWDPDGAGPATPLLVFAGTFGAIGNIAAANIAAFDPLTGVWSPLGSGLVGPLSYECVNAITVFQGEVFVAGRITSAGGVPVNSIARWNGSSWSGLGAGLASGGTGQGIGSCMVVDGASLVVGGLFQNSGSTLLNNVARWNGASWSAIGGGLGTPSSYVRAIGRDAAGGLIAGGYATGGMQRWNGTAWAPTAFLSGEPSSIVTWNGNVIATNGEGVWQWNGTNWLALGALGGVGRLAVSGGQLFAAGSLAIPGGVARWTGTAWAGLGAPDTWAGAIGDAPSLGGLVTTGLLNDAGSYVLSSHETLRRWNGSSWSALVPNGTNGLVMASAELPNGDLVVAGDFTVIGGVGANRIARWNGTTWSSLGAGTNATVFSLLALPNGDLVVGGNFTTAGGANANRIARWNGSGWSTFGAGLNGLVRVLAPSADPNYEFWVGGDFTTRLAKWSPSFGSFATLGIGILNGGVRAIANAANGDIFVGGSFTAAGSTPLNRVARVTGNVFAALGNGANGSVESLLVLPNGDLVAGGNFTAAGIVGAEKIARWNGAAWSSLGTGMQPAGATIYGPFVTALAALPNGDVLAAGRFTSAGGVSGTQNLARWNGTAWSPVASNGTVNDSNLGAVFYPFSFTMQRDGDLLVTGSFTAVGSAGFGSFAELQSSCPATGFTYDAGCIGSAGQVAIEMVSRPWIGGTYSVRSSGLPSNALVFCALGYSRYNPPLPLSLLLPQALPGCLMSHTGDLLNWILPIAGTATFSAALPLNPGLVGTQFYAQTLVLELDASGAVSAGTTSNGLGLTIGAF
jgi:hypothetical protein